MKIYGSPLCKDCVACTDLLDSYGMHYEYHDITSSMKELKEFLALRDKLAVFEEVKQEGNVGVPTLVFEDGTVRIDWEACLKELGIEGGVIGHSCGIHGC